jgi:hypothetical protein
VFGFAESNQADRIYPYTTETDYNKALNRYTLQGVVGREALNGITFDSVAALTGIQDG